MKNCRENELKSYVLGCVLIIVFISTKSEMLAYLDGKHYDLLILLISSGILSTVFYSFVFVFDSILPVRFKEIVSSLSAHLPGERVWSEIKSGKKDKRFTNKDVLDKYKEIFDGIPNNNEKRAYENSKWYSVYSKVEKHKKVEQAQKDYLLCRDLTSANIVMMVIYILFSLGLKVLNFSWHIVVLFTLFYLLMVVATRNKAKRFVYTVIATDLYAKNIDSKNE